MNWKKRGAGAAFSKKSLPFAKIGIFDPCRVCQCPQLGKAARSQGKVIKEDGKTRLAASPFEERAGIRKVNVGQDRENMKKSREISWEIP